MAYQYDAFFSYKRDRESDSWHERVKDKLTFWLKHELGRQDVRIYFDTSEIRGGMQWSEELRTALRRSKCLVCFWSPLYFQSKWCVSEWLSFAERSRKLNRQLILPASYFDGENFPSRAREIQFLDFSEFASTLPRFWDTEAAVRFEDQRIRPFARDLAALIRQAPPFDDSFPLIEAPDEQVLSEPAIGRIADV
jgi:TIR domain